MRVYFRTFLVAIILGIDVILLVILLNLTGWLESDMVASGPTPTPWPTATPLVAAKPTPTPRTSQIYVVRPGDVLADIAKRYGMAIEDIQKASNITDVNSIRAGQAITIPVVATPGP